MVAGMPRGILRAGGNHHMDRSAQDTRMEELGIDAVRSREILQMCNSPGYQPPPAVAVRGIPGIDGTRIIDRAGLREYSLEDEAYQRVLRDLAPEIPAERYGTVRHGMRTLSFHDLETIGILLYPYLSYGVLNGGSATSYADRWRNRGYDEELFELYRHTFDGLSAAVTRKPKGITPAYINPDGTYGASFLELKFRMLLLAGEQYKRTVEQEGITPRQNQWHTTTTELHPCVPFFEMTSAATEEMLADAYRQYRSSEILRDFPDAPRVLEVRRARQPLLAAMTHREDGTPLKFFETSGDPLGLPGGHGQSFSVLAEVYRQLLAEGKRFVYLGNVDNLGFTVDPVSLAITALTEAPGGFDFAFRTPVDIKGGILVRDQEGRLNCVDIGPAISRDEVFRAEAEGSSILFNCATGLFNLSWLCTNLDRIIGDLPVRISDQDKDAGRYSHAEQVTWEVIAMMDGPLIFGIDKYRRFLAAKMLLETLLTSGLHQEKAAALQPTIRELHEGMHTVLREEYRMELRDQRYRPV